MHLFANCISLWTFDHCRHIFDSTDSQNAYEIGVDKFDAIMLSWMHPSGFGYQANQVFSNIMPACVSGDLFSILTTSTRLDTVSSIQVSTHYSISCPWTNNINVDRILFHVA
jgi:hypothetical protein